MNSLEKYLIGKEVSIGEEKAGIISVSLTGHDILVRYETDDGGSGSWELRPDTVTEFLDDPYGDIPSMTADGLFVIAQTGYSSSGVVIAVYDKLTDTVSEGHYSKFSFDKDID